MCGTSYWNCDHIPKHTIHPEIVLKTLSGVRVCKDCVIKLKGGENVVIHWGKKRRTVRPDEVDAWYVNNKPWF